MDQKVLATNQISDSLLDDIKQAIASKDYGSVEIYIESGRIVQITERTIKKTASKVTGNSGLRLGSKR